ncbi:metallophosphoesterase family protein [Amycolatopsis aidingensis]|uniref:metallophosphoesterase family protein n=1 Tax=Amycolatopsis aidingensis TaxID=2842453 RepID=UPI001C0E4A35|nr:metallophosphoesterase family protein [Amycolatopsis aidingensis]
MIERVAVLSDIHGVLPALQAVLAEPEVAAADLVLLTGDMAAGPQPSATMDLLAGLGERALWVSGNADRELVTLAGGGQTEIPDPIAPWAAGQLTPAQLERLAALPATASVEVRGLGPVLFCHATPRDDEEIVLADSAPARWLEVLDGVDPRVRTVVCGHTHMPFTRLVGGRTVVNPGSVGMPYGTAGAHWALLGGSAGPAIQLRRTMFDTEAACKSIMDTSGYPGVAEWVDTFVRNPASDLEAHAVFAPLDGR